MQLHPVMGARTFTYITSLFIHSSVDDDCTQVFKTASVNLPVVLSSAS